VDKWPFAPAGVLDLCFFSALSRKSGGHIEVTVPVKRVLQAGTPVPPAVTILREALTVPKTSH